MSADTILAIDLGRYKSVACVYAPGHPRRTPSAHSTPRPTNSTRLLARHPGAVVVIEACANAGWVHDRAVAAGHAVKVANTAAEAWKFKHLKRKTDRDDALRLAQLEALGQLPTVALPDPATRQRRMLIAFRQELVGRRVACQNRIRALFVGQGLPAPRGARAWTETGLAGIERQAQAAGRVRPGRAVAGDAGPGAGRVPGPGRADRPGRRRGSTRSSAADAGDAAAGDDPRGRARGRPRRWWPTWATRSGSRRPSRSGPTPGWCRGSTRAG